MKIQFHLFIAACICCFLKFGFASPVNEEFIESSEPVPSVDITLEDFLLTGKLSEHESHFTLTATADVKNYKNGALPILSGEITLLEIPKSKYYQIKLEQKGYALKFKRNGRYPVTLHFAAKKVSHENWNTLSFTLADATLRPFQLSGLSPETEFKNHNSSKPTFAGEHFIAHLYPGHPFELSWRKQKTATHSAPLYSTQIIEHQKISPGLLKQQQQISIQTLQGEIKKLVFDLAAVGEITEINGLHILNWEVVKNKNQRTLHIHFNQKLPPQYTFTLKAHTPLNAFPQAVEPLRVVPQKSARFTQYLKIQNQGSVKFKTLQARGLTQIPLEEFPGLATPEPSTKSSQSLTYRTSSTDFHFKIKAEPITPEVFVSQIQTHHFNRENTLITGSFELDIRQAPLREFSLRLPAHTVLSQIENNQLSDYFVTPHSETQNTLRVVFNKPLLGRQILKIQLEDHTPTSATTKKLSPIVPLAVKDLRGFMGITSEDGLRLDLVKTKELTEMATAFYPQPSPQLQLAYRLRSADWQAQITLTQLAKSLQSDALHLFSVGEGIALGSSVLNLKITGAPIAELQLRADAHYKNLEFSGAHIRSWKQKDDIYTLSFDTSIKDSYTLLATYETPLAGESSLLDIAGIEVVNSHSAQGYLTVISNAAFKTEAQQLSSDLIELEAQEIPEEYRLLFDAPVLAAYQYTQRPLHAELQLTALSHGETMKQVVDVASLQTHVSRKGEILTTVQYLLKNSGQSHFALTLPPQLQLWSVTANKQTITPIVDNAQTLLPLPLNTSANTPLTLELKLAQKNTAIAKLKVLAPIAHAPILLTEWNLTTDEGHELIYHSGSLTPQEISTDKAFQKEPITQSLEYSIVFLLFAGGLCSAWVAIRNAQSGRKHRKLIYLLLCICCWGLSLGIFLSPLLKHTPPPLTSESLVFSETLQPTGSEMHLTIIHQTLESAQSVWLSIWPALLGICGYLVLKLRLRKLSAGLKTLFAILSWAFIFFGIFRFTSNHSVLGILFAIALFFEGILPWFHWLRIASVQQLSKPTASSLLVGLFTFAFIASESRANASLMKITQEITIDQNDALCQAEFTWKAEKNQEITFLNQPALLTQIELNSPRLNLLNKSQNTDLGYRLKAKKAGLYVFKVHYQLKVDRFQESHSIRLSVPPALIHRVNFTIDKTEQQIHSDQAISITSSKTDAAHKLMLCPVASPVITWYPQSRDTSQEETSFYTTTHHLIAPTQGLIESVHLAKIKPARGQIDSLHWKLAPDITVTEVNTPKLGSWHYDAANHLLKVDFQAVQTRPFSVAIHTQYTTAQLPYSQQIQLPQIIGAHNQHNLIGIATAPDTLVTPEATASLTAMSLEDFPFASIARHHRQHNALQLNHAFRSSQADLALTLQAQPVRSDIRVFTEEKISLGLDRIVHAIRAECNITRAGVFHLQFALPAGFDVEAISSPSLSQWTEQDINGQRGVTLHLKNKSIGKHTFVLNLVSSGVDRNQQTLWNVPRFQITQASKQQGKLSIVPERGLRLHSEHREGITDQKLPPNIQATLGTQAFRLLNKDWQLTLGIEKVPTWIEVNSQQHSLLSPGKLEITAWLNYNIENSGLKQLTVQLPPQALGVSFIGDHISDFQLEEGSEKKYTLQLKRNIIGGYPLQVRYHFLLSQKTDEPLPLTGIHPLDANISRSFLTFEESGRQRIHFPKTPESLQPLDNQSIPSALKMHWTTQQVHHCFRVIDPDFTLPLISRHHKIAELLPARVHSVELHSIVANHGTLITRTRLTLDPFDKPYLKIKLPPGSQFWFAFANKESIWPWQEEEHHLLPLDKHAVPNQPTEIEFYYVQQLASQHTAQLHGKLRAPQFDLPLEDITWRLSLSNQWKIGDWESSLTFIQQEKQSSHFDYDAYLSEQQSQLLTDRDESESLLVIGNALLAQGQTQEARKAFSSAYRRSRHDVAFNEDARIQLNNLKTQQALIGLSNRNSFWLEEQASPSYSQSTFTQLAQRLIEQQETALLRPEAIRITLPEVEQHFIFKRSLLIDPQEPLEINVKAEAHKNFAAFDSRIFPLLALFSLIALMGKHTHEVCERVVKAKVIKKIAISLSLTSALRSLMGRSQWLRSI